MTNNEFRQKIYGPYHDIWKLIKIIEFAGPKDDDLWIKYMEGVSGFQKAYPKTNEEGTYEGFLMRALFEAADIIAKENKTEVETK